MQHAIEVKALGLLGEVGVVGEGEADIGEDLVVIGPCWVGEVDGRFLGVEFGQEETAQVDSAGSRDSLQRADLRSAGEIISLWNSIVYISAEDSGGGKDDVCIKLEGRDLQFGSTYPFLLDCWTGCTDNELLCSRGEIR